jgi:nucleotide-binding universal stress UspA family protein
MPGIVVGVDGSQHSHLALVQAMKEAAAHHEPLTVVTVHQAIRDVYGAVSHYGEDPALTAKAREAAQAEVDQALADIGDSRPESVTVKAVHGLPADELIRASEGADMIVLGSRGTGGFARLLMGTVTSQVAHHARCPVLIVPSEDRR